MRRFYFFPIFGFLLFACSSNSDVRNESSVSAVLPDEVNEVRAMRLEYTDFQHELIANGTVSAHKADLRFQTSENIVAIYVKNGDRVYKGQKIAMLDQFKLENNLAQAKDNLERAYLDLQDALITQGYMHGDSAQVRKEVLQIAKMRSNYPQMRNQYELAEYNYKNSILYAPFDGVVANLFTQAYNMPNTTEPFCTIIDDTREADFKILESELPFVHIGDKVQVSPFSVSNYTCEGRISEINPSIDKNGMVRIKASIHKASASLYDGMNVKLKLQRTFGRQLVVPKEALVLRNNRKVIFTLKGGKAQWAYVQTGLENESGYVVTDGLAVGDSVIYEGNINLAHETPVKVKNSY
jgi:RND family efflux transporter MFP subunit